jgi:hypothetical protein
MFPYIGNSISVQSSIAPTRVTATGTTNGTAIDLGQSSGSAGVYAKSGTTSAGTLTFTVEDSADGSTGWAAIDASALVSPTTGDADTLGAATTSAGVDKLLIVRKENVERYIRIVATAATNPTVVFSGVVVFPRHTS